jgi:CheY-like chemotaxis protein
VPTPTSRVVLIVDDEKSFTEVLSQTLAGYLDAPIVTFARPVAALEALPKLDVGVIVTDYFMPQMSGVEFLRRALQLKPATPCVIITGHRDALADQGLPEFPELKEVLAKPFTSRVLASAIQKHWPAVPGNGSVAA